MDNYECHINMVFRHGRDMPYAEEFARREGWKLSCISDDEGTPLDDGVLFLTCHASDFEKIFKKMARTFDALEADAWLRPVRRKIEHVVYDVREPA